MSVGKDGRLNVSRIKVCFIRRFIQCIMQNTRVLCCFTFISDVQAIYHGRVLYFLVKEPDAQRKLFKFPNGTFS